MLIWDLPWFGLANMVQKPVKHIIASVIAKVFAGKYC